MPRHFRGYAKTYGVYKIEKNYFVINTEKSWPDLGLATGDQDIRPFNLETQFLSYNFALLK
jgi:hypothetical protein